MGRLLKDWLPAFMDYTSGTEAPRLMHFWVGVSTIAGALRRKVWIDMKKFDWIPNFYVIFVAKPGVVSKTTTMDLGMNLLKQVPGIKFGPDTVTWQSMPGELEKAAESFFYDGAMLPMCPLTFASGELGGLVDPQDKQMMNFYIQMWDGRRTYDKVTKTSGNDSLECPWVNLIGCTTPHWMADNIPSAAVGGGFTSRCIFVYAEKKTKLVPLPDEHTIPDEEGVKKRLINDLEHMATNLAGPFTIPEDARAWIRSWYEGLWTKEGMYDTEHLEGYKARKQTHMMKLAMILSVSRSDALEISLEDLILANTMLEEAEKDLEKVFSRIGRTEESLQAERLLQFIKRYGRVSYSKALQHVHAFFPDFHDYEGVLTGLIRAGLVKMEFSGAPTMKMGADGKPNLSQDAWLVYTGE